MLSASDAINHVAATDSAGCWSLSERLEWMLLICSTTTTTNTTPTDRQSKAADFHAFGVALFPNIDFMNKLKILFCNLCGYRSVELLQLLLSLNCFFSLFLTHIFILTQISSSLNWMFIQMVYSELNTWQNIFSDNKWSQVNLRNIFNKTYRIFIVYDLTEKFAFWLHTILQVTRKTTWHIHSFLTNYVEHTHPKTAKPITELVTRTRYIHCPCQQHLPPTAQNVR